MRPGFPYRSHWSKYVFKCSKLSIGPFWAIVRPSRPNHKNFTKIDQFEDHGDPSGRPFGVPWWSKLSETLTTRLTLIFDFQRALVCSKMLRNNKVSRNINLGPIDINLEPTREGTGPNGLCFSHHTVCQSWCYDHNRLFSTDYDCFQMIIISKMISYHHVFDVKQPVYILMDLMIFSMFLDICDEF